MLVFKLLTVAALAVVFFQIYHYAVTRGKLERQKACRSAGILFFSVGAAMLILRDAVFGFLGLAVMMAGLKLIANGLDRLDKNIFIDRFRE